MPLYDLSADLKLLFSGAAALGGIALAAYGLTKMNLSDLSSPNNVPLLGGAILALGGSIAFEQASHNKVELRAEKTACERISNRKK